MAIETEKGIIAASILAGDLSRLADETRRLLVNGADWIHIDVMDGHFVENITFGPSVISNLRKNLPNAFFDVHCMVQSPEKWLPKFAPAKINQYTFHFEAVHSDVTKAIQLCNSIHELGIYAGIAIKPNTPVETIFPLIELNMVSTVLVMTVNPGFGGQKFMPETMSKVVQLHAKYPSLAIEVDGGLDMNTTKIAAQSGASIIVAGTSIFSAENMKQYISQLRTIVNEYKKSECSQL